jgi:colanic acid/amylovoran biosynthesis glycosyltransferase
MTLHGSDLLLHAAYLDTKLKHCVFCVTISEFNRRYILKHHSAMPAHKIVVRRMGVDPGPNKLFVSQPDHKNRNLAMLAAGRLHPVKDHAFLVRACRLLKDREVPFECVIAGEGPERASIESLIRDLALTAEVRLVGHLSRPDLDRCYARADLVVLTSRSEGIPLVLMEAMARGKTVLAPAITGIPELVLDGKNGFLYRPGSIEDFAARVALVHDAQSAFGSYAQAARQHVLQHFNRDKNLAAFCTLLLQHIPYTKSAES